MLEKLFKYHKLWVEMAKLFDNNNAEDIVQDAYIKLAMYATEEKCFINGKPNKNYLFIVIRNTYLSLYKGKFVVVDFIDSETEEDFSETIELDWYRFRTLCEAEVNSWDAYDKKLFTLYRDSDMSMRKLAKETGISFVSIFHSLKAHKKKLRELFQEDYNNLEL
jgi:DNA-directed RNA polymerase specialized sigma24 family protein